MDEYLPDEQHKLLERLKTHWTAQGVKIRPGASRQEIESFESRYQVRLPDDLRAYFSSVDGMDEWDVDNDMFSFHSLPKVKNVTEDLAHFGGIPDYTAIVHTLNRPDRWFVIVDFLICSAVYAVDLSEERCTTPVHRICDDTHHRIVAPSFAAFLEAYLDDPVRIY